MFKAIDREGNEVLAWNASKSGTYRCPICDNDLILRMGDVRVHHFAHAKSADERGSGCTDRWNYDKTPWHITWQKRFPEKCCEKMISIGEKKHFADVCINDLIIEFQHSPISLEEFRERNTFYKNAGYRVIWVFDVIEDWSEEKIEEDHNESNKYYWSSAGKVFREMNVKNEDAVIYFQFSDYEDEETCVLERVTGGYRRFSWFYTSGFHALSISEFFKAAMETDSPLIPKKREALPDSVPGGSSISDLWKPEYASMIVTNLCTGKTMIIFGNYGKMEREKKGMIVGKYTWKTKEGYGYSEKLPVWDAEKSIWRWKHSKNRADI